MADFFRLSLTLLSGLLHERLPVLLLISAYRSTKVTRGIWLHHSRFHIRLHCFVCYSFFDDQIHWPLQIFHYSWRVHLYHGLVSFLLFAAEGRD